MTFADTHNGARQSEPHARPPKAGHNADPLAALTPRELFHACVWIAPISSHKKLFLLCIGRYLDEDARSSSMSYAQVARDCGMAESSAKRIAKEVVLDGFLTIEVGKGHQTSRGFQNLYHGRCRDEDVERVRSDAIRYGVSGCGPNGVGVSEESPSGSQTKTPRCHMGSHRNHLGSHSETSTSLTHKEEKEQVGSSPETPYFDAGALIISRHQGLIIPRETIEGWRARFPSLPDLDAAVESLGAKVLHNGPMRASWTAPAAWMANILATDNKRAEDQAKLADARVASAKSRRPAPLPTSDAAKLIQQTAYRPR